MKKIPLKWKVLVIFAFLFVLIGSATGIMNPGTFDSFWDRILYGLIQTLLALMFAIGILIRVNPCVYGSAGCPIFVGEWYGFTLGLNGTIVDFNTSFLQLFVPIYVTLWILLGFYLIFMQGSPQGRSRAKMAALDLFIGMILVSLSPMIFQMLSDISGGLVERIVTLGGAELEDLALGVTNPGSICTMYCISYYAWIVLILTFFVVLARYLLLVMLASVFPLTLFLYSFALTKGLGNTLLKITLLTIFSQVLMAVFLVMAMIASASGSGFGTWDNLLFSTAAFTAVVLTPLIMLKLSGWVGAVMFAYSSTGGSPFTRALGRMLQGQPFGYVMRSVQAARYDTTQIMGRWERGGEKPGGTAYEPWSIVEPGGPQRVTGFPKGRIGATTHPYGGRSPSLGSSVMSATGGARQLGGTRRAGVGGLQGATPRASARASARGMHRRIGAPSRRPREGLRQKFAKVDGAAERAKKDLAPPPAGVLSPKPSISSADQAQELQRVIMGEKLETQRVIQREKYQQMLKKMSRGQAKSYGALGLNDEQVANMATGLPAKGADNFYKVLPYMAEPLHGFGNKSQAIRDVVAAGKEDPELLKGGKDSKIVGVVNEASKDKNPNESLKRKLETRQAKQMRELYATNPKVIDQFNMVPWEAPKRAWENLIKIGEKQSGGVGSFIMSERYGDMLKRAQLAENPDAILREEAGIEAAPLAPEAPPVTLERAAPEAPTFTTQEGQSRLHTSLLSTFEGAEPIDDESIAAYERVRANYKRFDDANLSGDEYDAARADIGKIRSTEGLSTADKWQKIGDRLTLEHKGQVPPSPPPVSLGKVPLAKAPPAKVAPPAPPAKAPPAPPTKAPPKPPPLPPTEAPPETALEAPPEKAPEEPPLPPEKALKQAPPEKAPEEPPLPPEKALKQAPPAKAPPAPPTKAPPKPPPLPPTEAPPETALEAPPLEYPRALEAAKRGDVTTVTGYVKQGEISDEQRVEMAQGILGRELSAKEKSALIEAHHMPGTIDELSQREVTAKGRKLLRTLRQENVGAGMSKKDARLKARTETQLLMDTGLVGAPPEAPPAKAPKSRVKPSAASVSRIESEYRRTGDVNGARKKLQGMGLKKTIQVGHHENQTKVNLEAFFLRAKGFTEQQARAGAYLSVVDEMKAANERISQKLRGLNSDDSDTNKSAREWLAREINAGPKKSRVTADDFIGARYDEGVTKDMQDYFDSAGLPFTLPGTVIMDVERYKLPVGETASFATRMGHGSASGFYSPKRGAKGSDLRSVGLAVSIGNNSANLHEDLHQTFRLSKGGKDNILNEVHSYMSNVWSGNHTWKQVERTLIKPKEQGGSYGFDKQKVKRTITAVKKLQKAGVSQGAITHMLLGSKNSDEFIKNYSRDSWRERLSEKGMSRTEIDRQYKEMLRTYAETHQPRKVVVTKPISEKAPPEAPPEEAVPAPPEEAVPAPPEEAPPAPPEEAPPTPLNYDKNRKFVGQLLGKDLLTEFNETFKKESVRWTTMKHIRELVEILGDRPVEVRDILRRARTSKRPEYYIRNVLKEHRAKKGAAPTPPAPPAKAPPAPPSPEEGPADRGMTSLETYFRKERDRDRLAKLADNQKGGLSDAVGSKAMDKYEDKEGAAKKLLDEGVKNPEILEKGPDGKSLAQKMLEEASDQENPDAALGNYVVELCGMCGKIFMRYVGK